MAAHGERRGANRRRWRSVLMLAVSMGCALTLLALVAPPSLGGMDGVPVARAHSRARLVGDAPLASPTATETPTETVTPTETPTETPTPSPTPTPPPPTLALVSPTSGTGPVGARVTITGTRWGTGAVQVGVASSSAGCPTPSAWLVSLGTPSVAGGAFTFTALWPLSLGALGTTYAICARNGAGGASVAYQVLAATPPILSLSAASIQVGQAVTIHGANFYGVASVTLTLRTTNGTRVLTNLAPFGDGTFGYPYIAGTDDAGTVTISAASAAEGSAPPALQASAVLSVVGLGVPTASLGATATTTLGGQGGALNTTAQAPRLPWLPLLLAVVALLLAVVALLLMLLVRRPRGAPAGGFSQTDLPAAVGGVATGRMATGGPRAAPGTGPLSAGGGEAWQAADAWAAGGAPGDEGPGPDWHPRPMGGTRARMPAVEAGEDAPAGEQGGWEEPAWPPVAPYASGYQYTPPLAYAAPGLPAGRWEGDPVGERRVDAAATNPDGAPLAAAEATAESEGSAGMDGVASDGGAGTPGPRGEDGSGPQEGDGGEADGVGSAE